MNYSYDANGNLISTTAGQSFSWDVFNRLTQATGSGGQVSYTYNGDGLKVRRAGPEGGATIYYYDGIRPIWEADGAGTPKVQLDRDIFGNLLGRREVSSGVRRYFAHDGLGGLTAITDEAGAPWRACSMTLGGTCVPRVGRGQEVTTGSRGRSWTRRRVCTTWGRDSTTRA